MELVLKSVGPNPIYVTLLREFVQGSRVVFILNEAEFAGVENLPLLRTEYLKPVIDFSAVNSLIVTSKKALTALEMMGAPWRDKHLFAVGEATAEAVRSLGGSVYYCAEGYGEALAKTIIRSYPLGKYLYCRGKEVATDVGGLLRRSNVRVDDAVVYTTRCDTDIRADIPKGSVIIFTSPKTVRCFLKNWEWDASWKAVAIGKTTAKALPKTIAVSLPASPSFSEAVALAKGLEN